MQFCGFSLVALVVLHAPTFALRLWPIAFGPRSVNVYLTLLPPLAAAAYPALAANLALGTVPRVAAADGRGDRYMYNGGGMVEGARFVEVEEEEEEEDLPLGGDEYLLD